MGVPCVTAASRAEDQPRGARDPRRRPRDQGRRLHRHQRHQRRGHARRRPARRSHRGPGVRRDPRGPSRPCSAGPTTSAGSGCARTPTRRTTPTRRASWARRASACAGRSTCSWPRTASRRCGAMIMADDADARKDALAELLPLQQEDFEGLFEAMKGLPVTIRLLDPPLHEFLPDLPDLAAQVERARIECTDDLEELEKLLATTERISEENPMLGTRGCRLGILYPEIYEMQVHAIMRAAKAMDEPPHPEIMIPLVDYEQEIEIMRELVVRIGDEEGLHEAEDYTVGTMIELPRACFVADRIAKHADFFSFGTNDLTQTALGFSRDDVEIEVRAGLHGAQDHRPLAVRDDRQAGRRLARAARRVGRARGASRTSSSASAASTAATRTRSSSSTWPASTTCPARRSGSRSRASPPRRRRSSMPTIAPGPTRKHELRAETAAVGPIGAAAPVRMGRVTAPASITSDFAAAQQAREAAWLSPLATPSYPARREREEPDCGAAHAVPARPRPDRALARRSGGSSTRRRCSSRPRATTTARGSRTRSRSRASRARSRARCGSTRT